MNQHVDRNHRQRTEVFPCNICDYKANLKINLSKHVEHNHSIKSQNLTKIKCVSCDYVGIKSNMKAHENVHANEKHKCDKCNYEGKSKIHLKTHVQKMHTEREMQYKCNICEFKSKEKSGLKYHIDNMHLGLTKECPICCKIMKSHSIRRHIKDVHEIGEIHKCTLCEYTSKRSGEVNFHMRVKHTNQQNFECEQCTYKTDLKNRLDRHIGTVHTKSINFPCSLCDHKSQSRKDLRRHIDAKHNK